MPKDISGYVYAGTVSTGEICDGVSQLEDKIDEFHGDLDLGYSNTVIGCAVLSLGSAYVSSGTATVVVATVCGGRILGCAIQNGIENHTPCGDQLIDIYLPEDASMAHSTEAALLMLRCDKDISDDIDALSDDLQDAADDISDAAVNTGEEIADELDNALDSVEDVADDLISGGMSLLP